jgi:hypothetical protein
VTHRSLPATRRRSGGGGAGARGGRPRRGGSRARGAHASSGAKSVAAGGDRGTLASMSRGHAVWVRVDASAKHAGARPRQCPWGRMPTSRTDGPALPAPSPGTTAASTSTTTAGTAAARAVGAGSRQTPRSRSWEVLIDRGVGPSVARSGGSCRWFGQSCHHGTTTSTSTGPTVAGPGWRPSAPPPAHGCPPIGNLWERGRSATSSLEDPQGDPLPWGSSAPATRQLGADGSASGPEPV